MHRQFLVAYATKYGATAENDVALFHGASDPEKLNSIEKWMLKNVKAHVGDFLDCEAITSRAGNIAEELQE